MKPTNASPFEVEGKVLGKSSWYKNRPTTEKLWLVLKLFGEEYNKFDKSLYFYRKTIQ